MKWTVTINRKAERQALSLPRKVVDRLRLLTEEIKLSGPVRGNWPNYSRLSSDRHHCHLKKGKPTYVAVWREEKESVVVEIIYVGTHEKAPY